MHRHAYWARGHCPVRWLNRHALVTLPERVEESNAGVIGEQLMSIVKSDVLVLILDMTATVACDHAGGDALARVYQRAMACGTELRPVVTDEGVRRVLTVSGVGRLVPVYAAVGAALAATRPGDNIAVPADGASGQPAAMQARTWTDGRPHRDVGTEVALLAQDGRSAGATVTLSLTRSQTRVLLPGSTPGGTRSEAAAAAGAAPGPGPDAAFAGDLTGRLAGVARILEESAGQACANLAGQLHRALGELDAVIKDAHAASVPRGPEPEG
jgi:anti-anti-sigma regulatory factor